jgi:hypothetical protein
VVTPFVIESEYPGAKVEHLRMRTGKMLRDCETVGHGQVVGCEGDQPVETARNGFLWIGSYSKYGFGEPRVRVVDPRDEELTEGVIENSAKLQCEE